MHTVRGKRIEMKGGKEGDHAYGEEKKNIRKLLFSG
jgi:hypothetical protein